MDSVANPCVRIPEVIDDEEFLREGAPLLAAGHRVHALHGDVEPPHEARQLHVVGEHVEQDQRRRGVLPGKQQ